MEVDIDELPRKYMEASLEVNIGVADFHGSWCNIPCKEIPWKLKHHFHGGKSKLH